MHWNVTNSNWGTLKYERHKDFKNSTKKDCKISLFFVLVRCWNNILDILGKVKYYSN